MSSSQGDKRSSDVEMGEATSEAPVPASSIEVPACVAGHLSFREKLAHRKAEKEPVRAGTEFPSSSTTVVALDHGAEVQVRRTQDLKLARALFVFRTLLFSPLDRLRL